MTKENITTLAEEFVDDYLTTDELKNWFIDQVFDYADGCCETEQEVLCFVDGLLMGLVK